MDYVYKSTRHLPHSIRIWIDTEKIPWHSVGSYMNPKGNEVPLRSSSFFSFCHDPNPHIEGKVIKRITNPNNYKW